MNLGIAFLAGLCVFPFCPESLADKERAQFLSANNAMHFAWFNDNTVVK
jgi:hypothetical protein